CTELQASTQEECMSRKWMLSLVALAAIAVPTALAAGPGAVSSTPLGSGSAQPDVQRPASVSSVSTRLSRLEGVVRAQQREINGLLAQRATANERVAKLERKVAVLSAAKSSRSAKQAQLGGTTFFGDVNILGNLTVGGMLNAPGTSLTNLNASNLTSGTV